MTSSLPWFVLEIAPGMSAWMLIAWNWVFPWLTSRSKSVLILTRIAGRGMLLAGLSQFRE